MAVVPVTSTPTPLAGPQGAGTAQPSTSQVNFGELVQGLLKDTNAQQVQADVALRQLVSGETENIHGVVLSAVQADLSFRLAMEIRNRLVESYQEIMRMQF